MYGAYDSFEAVAAKLGNRATRKVANNTYLHRLDEETIALRLHATNVLIFRPEYVEMQTGGWFSVTTRDRLNYNSGARVFSEKGTWYVSKVGNWEERQRFYDGIRVSYSGEVLNPLPLADGERIAAANDKVKREISRYIKLSAAKLSEGLPLPSGGDCWYCAMVTSDGKPLGDASGNHDHLREHMTEGYVVPSLLWHAVSEAGYRYPEIILGATSDGLGKGCPMTDSVTRALRKYLKARLLTNEQGVKPAGSPPHTGGY